MKRLESAGLVTRQRHPGDERLLAVTLTPSGRELRRRAASVPPAVAARLDTDIGELEHLRDQLTALITATDSSAHPQNTETS